MKRVWDFLLITCALFVLLAVSSTDTCASERLYIDIIKAPRKLPIAVMDLSGPRGEELAGIIRDDLTFSGLFQPIPKDAFMESVTEPFKGSNWTGTGVEAVVKGSVTIDTKLHMVIRLYDVFDGNLVLERKYSADQSLLRALAHAAANDIFQKITGQNGMFRTKIAYTVQTGQGQELYLADWDGQRGRSLGLKAGTFTSLRWTPDGSSLIYSAQRGKSWSIYQLSFNERKENMLFSGPGLNLAGDYLPNGKSFALSSSREGTSDIYIFEPGDKKLKRLTNSRSIEVSPTVSPDGSQIAYVSDQGGTPQIYRMDNFGYNKSRITFEGNYNTSPVWSPRGDILAFSGRNKGKHQIFIIRPDGTDLRMLTSEGNNEEPSFSPDGRFLSFTSDRDGNKAVYIMRANGEEQTRITPPGIKAQGSRWSPK